MEESKCERALKHTRETKNTCMKKVLRVKETNRYFFKKETVTNNKTKEDFDGYYYPDKNLFDDIPSAQQTSQYTSTTKDSSSPNEDK